MLVALAAAGWLMCACGSSGGAGDKFPPQQPPATPTISTSAAQNGAVIVTLADATAGTTIYYTLDGSAPTNQSQIYEAPFLVAGSLTVKAMADVPTTTLNSEVASQTFILNIPSGTLVWSDEFTNSGSAPAEPNPAAWTYDTGNSGFGNHELENYCAWGSIASPCSTAIQMPTWARMATCTSWRADIARCGRHCTSARLKSQGLFSFMYGRVELRACVARGAGNWPAFWLMGNNIATVHWPACGEIDILEHIDGSNPPPSVGAPAPGYDWIAGSVHGGTNSNEANGTQHVSSCRVFRRSLAHVRDDLDAGQSCPIRLDHQRLRDFHAAPIAQALGPSTRDRNLSC